MRLECYLHFCGEEVGFDENERDFDLPLLVTCDTRHIDMKIFLSASAQISIDDDHEHSMFSAVST